MRRENEISWIIVRISENCIWPLFLYCFMVYLRFIAEKTIMLIVFKIKL